MESPSATPLATTDTSGNRTWILRVGAIAQRAVSQLVNDRMVYQGNPTKIRVVRERAAEAVRDAEFTLVVWLSSSEKGASLCERQTLVIPEQECSVRQLQ